MSFCMAGVALSDILTWLKKCRESFGVAGPILLRHFQKMSWIFRGTRNTLETSLVISSGRRSTLDVCCCVFFADRIVRAAWCGDNVQTNHVAGLGHRENVILRSKGSIWYRSVVCGISSCVAGQHFGHSTVHNLHSTLHTLHATQHLTLHTLHFTLHTPHFALYTPHSTLYSVHFTLQTPHFTLYTPHSTLHTSPFTLHTLFFTPYTYTPHSILSTLHFALHTLHSTIHT